MSRVTVFTPTYNRANTLHRVFESLCNQTYKDFEWIIVDDGSTDDTKIIVEKFCNNCDFSIKYYYEENAGKHTAINLGLKNASGEFFLIADSDDSFRNNALERFISVWNQIENKEEYKGIICRSYDVETGKPNGVFPAKVFDSNDLEGLFKYNLNFEKWSFIRTDIMKEFPFPTPNEKLKFFPETVIWGRMSKKYKTRYIDDCLRGYYRDQNNSLITRADARAKETKYLWIFFINETFIYLLKKPKYFLKSFIGLSRDIYLSHNNIFTGLKYIRGILKKIIYIIFIPIGFVFALFKKRKCKIND